MKYIFKISLLFIIPVLLIFGETAYASTLLEDTSLTRVPISDIEFTNKKISISEQVNSGGNLKALEQLGGFFYAYKIPLAISSLTAIGITCFYFAITLDTSPIILNAQLEPVLLEKINIPPLNIQPSFFPPATLYVPVRDANLPFVDTQTLSDLMRLDPRVGVNINQLHNMPARIQLYSINFGDPALVVDPYLSNHFVSVCGNHYDVYLMNSSLPVNLHDPAYSTITDYWIKQSGLTADLTRGTSHMYSQVALIPYGETSYTAYHRVDLVKPLLSQYSAKFVPEVLDSVFMKDFVANSAMPGP